MAEGKDVVFVMALVDWVVHENTVSWSWTSSCCPQLTLYGTCSIPLSVSSPSHNNSGVIPSRSTTAPAYVKAHQLFAAPAAPG